MTARISGYAFNPDHDANDQPTGKGTLILKGVSFTDAFAALVALVADPGSLRVTPAEQVPAPAAPAPKVEQTGNVVGGHQAAGDLTVTEPAKAAAPPKASRARAPKADAPAAPPAETPPAAEGKAAPVAPAPSDGGAAPPAAPSAPTGAPEGGEKDPWGLAPPELPTEAPEEPAPAAAPSGVDVAKLAKCGRLLDVVNHVIEAAKPKSQQELIAICESLKPQVPVLARAADLKDRVKRTMEAYGVTLG